MTHPQMLMTETLKLRRIEERSAEGLIVLGERAQSWSLKQALADGVRGAEAHARQLEYLCERKEWIPDGRVPRTLEGLQAEVREMLLGAEAGVVTDALIVCAIRKLAHLKIAAYETALVLAAGDVDLIHTLAHNLEGTRRADAEMDWILRRDIAPNVGKRETETTRR